MCFDISIYIMTMMITIIIIIRGVRPVQICVSGFATRRGVVRIKYRMCFVGRVKDV